MTYIHNMFVFINDNLLFIYYYFKCTHIHVDFTFSFIVSLKFFGKSKRNKCVQYTLVLALITNF